MFPRSFLLVVSSLTSLGVVSSIKHKASPLAAGHGKHKYVVLTIGLKLEICDLVTSRWLSSYFYYPDNLGYTDTQESASTQHCLDNQRYRTVWSDYISLII